MQRSWQLLHSSTEPIRDQTLDLDLPDLCARMLLADGRRPGSSIDAGLYGLGNARNTGRALARLKDRSLVTDKAGEWKIVDPLLKRWLAENSELLIASRH